MFVVLRKGRLGITGGRPHPSQRCVYRLGVHTATWSFELFVLPRWPLLAWHAWSS